VNTQQRATMKPTIGMMVYNLDTNMLNYYDGSAWRELTDAPA
jgi:hypothetical protein